MYINFLWKAPTTAQPANPNIAKHDAKIAASRGSGLESIPNLLQAPGGVAEQEVGHLMPPRRAGAEIDAIVSGIRVGPEMFRSCVA